MAKVCGHCLYKAPNQLMVRLFEGALTSPLPRIESTLKVHLRPRIFPVRFSDGVAARPVNYTLSLSWQCVFGRSAHIRVGCAWCEASQLSQVRVYEPISYMITGKLCAPRQGKCSNIFRICSWSGSIFCKSLYFFFFTLFFRPRSERRLKLPCCRKTMTGMCAAFR